MALYVSIDLIVCVHNSGRSHTPAVMVTSLPDAGGVSVPSSVASLTLVFVFRLQMFSCQ